MKRPFVARALVALALAGVAFLYYWRITGSPMYIAHDEAMFGVAAHEIAWHGRDVDGQHFPLMMPMSGVYWNMPAHVYFTALFVRLFGTTEAVIRTSSATASLLAVLLVYFFCRRVFRHRGFALLAAAVFALSPSYFIDSRQSTDHHYPAVAAGLWLLCLARYFDDPDREIWLGAAGLALGLGVYTYAASVLLMPIYVVATVLLLMRMRVRHVSAYAWLLAAAGVAALPFALFLLRTPGYIGDVAHMYGIYDSSRFNPLQGAHEVLNWFSLGARADVYFSYLNPSPLFFSGAPTHMVGFFLAPLMILLPAAVLYVARGDAEWYAWLAAVAFLATPLAAAIVDERGALQRVMLLALFGGVLVGYLVMRVSAEGRWWMRAATWLLVAWLPISFARFYVDYLRDYPQRSAIEFELNLRGALESAIDEARDQPVDICLSRRMNRFTDWFWKFYLRKHGAEALASRTIYFDGPVEARNRCVPGAIVVSEIASCDQIAATRTLAPKKILEPGGNASFCVW